MTNRTPDYAPSQTEALISYTFDDFKLFQRNQNQFLDRIQANDTLFNTVEEVGLINLNQQKVVFLSSFGAEGLSEHLYQNKVSVSSYQGSEIVEFKAKHLIESTFTPLIVDFVANYYSILDNTFIFLIEFIHKIHAYSGQSFSAYQFFNFKSEENVGHQYDLTTFHPRVGCRFGHQSPICKKSQEQQTGNRSPGYGQ